MLVLNLRILLRGYRLNLLGLLGMTLLSWYSGRPRWAIRAWTFWICLWLTTATTRARSWARSWARSRARYWRCFIWTRPLTRIIFEVKWCVKVSCYDLFLFCTCEEARTAPDHRVLTLISICWLWRDCTYEIIQIRFTMKRFFGYRRLQGYSLTKVILRLCWGQHAGSHLRVHMTEGSVDAYLWFFENTWLETIFIQIRPALAFK